MVIDEHELLTWLLKQVADDDSAYRDPEWWDAELSKRMLAECAAKRQLIAHVNEQWDSAYGEPGSFLPPEWIDVLKYLALPYVDRSGYRPEWAPDVD